MRIVGGDKTNEKLSWLLKLYSYPEDFLHPGRSRVITMSIFVNYLGVKYRGGCIFSFFKDLEARGIIKEHFVNSPKKEIKKIVLYLQNHGFDVCNDVRGTPKIYFIDLVELWLLIKDEPLYLQISKIRPPNVLDPRVY